ncbi:TPA: tail fiber assembly protein [Salmonella enterica subsp. enterica]
MKEKYLFSAKTMAFYPELEKDIYIKAGTLPDDVITVDSSVRDEFNFTPPTGKMLGIDDGGLPCWVDIPPPTRDELIQAAENERQCLLAYADNVMLDWRTELMLGEISDADRVKLSAWMAYKNDVKLTDVTSVPERVSWPVRPEE